MIEEVDCDIILVSSLNHLRIVFLTDPIVIEMLLLLLTNVAETDAIFVPASVFGVCSVWLNHLSLTIDCAISSKK